MVCIDTARCDFFDGLLDQFDNDAGGPYALDPDIVDPAAVSTDDLRGWWESHGCVRCWLEAWKQRPKWVRNCQDNGYDANLDDETYVFGNANLIGVVQKALQDWNDPTTRLPFRFHCQRHVEPLRCGCTLKDFWPGDLGHVGWVYGIPKAWGAAAPAKYRIAGNFMIGEMTISTGSDAVGSLCGDDAPFRGDPTPWLTGMEYQKWKPLWSRDGNYEEAYLMSRILRERGYLPNNNCNTAANAVLTAFGAELIPAAGDGFAGMFPPGDYFNFIRAPAVDLAPPAPKPKPKPRPNSATPDGGATEGVEDEPDANAEPQIELTDGPPLINAVYIGDNGSVAHLSLDCSAVQNMAAAPEEIGIDETDDLAAIEEEFGVPVCLTCQQMMAAGDRVVTSMETTEGTLYFCYRRLRYARPGGEVDIMHERITNHRAKLLAFTPTVLIDYRVPLPGGQAAARTLSLPFVSKAARDECLAELDVVRSS